MENQIKNLFLDYAAHLSINCEFVNPKNIPSKAKTSPILSHLGTIPLSHRRRFGNVFYRQEQIANCLANVLLIMDKLMKNHAKLLIINGHLSKLHLHLSGPTLTRQTKPEKAQISYNYNSTSLLQGGWVNGACSNWSRLRRVAWNSQQLADLVGRVAAETGGGPVQMESWFSEAESIFRGLQLLEQKADKINRFKLAYKHKPDCVFVINGSRAIVRECKALNVPLCILSSTTKFKVAASYLQSNRESCFLTYLVVSAILHLEKP